MISDEEVNLAGTALAVKLRSATDTVTLTMPSGTKIFNEVTSATINALVGGGWKGFVDVNGDCLATAIAVADIKL